MDALFLDSERAPVRIYICIDLRKWLEDGRATYRSTNNVVCVYETVPLNYSYNAIDRTYNKELHAEHDWEWLKKSSSDQQVASDQ